MFDLQGFAHLLLSGSVMTIELALTSLFIGLIFGLLGATAKLSKIWIFRKLATIYTSTMRGIPELLLVLFLYYGGSIILMSVMERFGYHEYIEISPFIAGVAALSLAFGAYATEVFRMAIQEIPNGQWEAAQAVGMRPMQIYFRIIIPQVWRLALPGLGNLFLVLLKDTALVSVVGLHDIMYYASRGAQATQEPFTFYMAAAVIYLGLTVVVTGVMLWLEWRANPAERYGKRLRKQMNKGVQPPANTI
ncbi:ABC transporter permease [Psychrobacter sp. I-STPA10]|uniref:ABC transporter permease n=1 Tax=Psychrobacter sp. I-STPA10 TaxID=2585769 RepID=UPI001E4855CD|nr:ABC transporter permease [Psychrobacter sp. I-STPA10]